MRQCGIVAGGSGDSVSTREELPHAKSGGQPSHNFYASHAATGTGLSRVYTPYILRTWLTRSLLPPPRTPDSHGTQAMPPKSAGGTAWLRANANKYSSCLL